MDFRDDRSERKRQPAGLRLELAGHSPWDGVGETDDQAAKRKKRAPVDLSPPSQGLDPSLPDCLSIEGFAPPPPPPEE